MTKKILLTKFIFNIPVDRLKQMMLAVAPQFADIAGCSWKIWFINEDQKESGGIYLFESLTELEQFLKSNLFTSVANNQAFSNVQTHTFGVMEAASMITGAPLIMKDA